MVSKTSHEHFIYIEFRSCAQWLLCKLDTSSFIQKLAGTSIIISLLVNFFMTEIRIISKPVQLFALQWFLYDRDLRHERVKSKKSNNTDSFKYNIEK